MTEPPAVAGGAAACVAAAQCCWQSAAWHRPRRWAPPITGPPATQVVLLHSAADGRLFATSLFHYFSFVWHMVAWR
jgi:hypothetical protein